MKLHQPALSTLRYLSIFRKQLLILLLAVAVLSVSACGTGAATVSTPPTTPPATPPADPTVTQAELNALKVMNYYPSAESWENMWTNWNATQINTDFGMIKALGANTVRVIVNMDAFGFPTPSSTMASELSQMISMANSNGLKVQLTLFDWWSDYTDIADSETFVTDLVGPYQNDSRIAFIELQNEISPEDSAAMTWTQTMLPFLQTTAGTIPVTVSVTNGASDGPAQELSNLISALGSIKPSFYDIHQYYGSPYEDYYQFSQAQQLATAQGLPLLIGETGASTSSADYSSINIPQTYASYEAWQDYTYRSAFYASSTLGLPAPAPWILWDFVPGSLTWLPSDSDQYDYGLYQADGTAKPAAADVSTFFSKGTLDTSFNNGFENYISGSPSLPTLWQIYKPSLGNFAIDTTEAHSGNASVKIWDSSSSSGGNPSFYIYPIAAITPNSSHTASVYVMGQDATGTTEVCLSWFSSSFGYLGNNCGGSLSGTTSWQQISVTATAPSGVAYVELFLTSANNTGTAWFDDVSFQ